MLRLHYDTVARAVTAVFLCLLFSLPTFASVATQALGIKLGSSCARKGNSHHCCCKSKAGTVGISAKASSCPSRCGQMAMPRLGHVAVEISTVLSSEPVATDTQPIETEDVVAGFTLASHQLHQRPPPSV